MTARERQLLPGPPPPPGGAQGAIKLARRRQQRARVLAVAGLFAGAIGTAAVTLAAGGGQSVSQDRLDQANLPRQERSVGTASAAPVPSMSPTPGSPPPAVRALPAPGQDGPASRNLPQTATSAVAETPASGTPSYRTPSYRTPQMSRTESTGRPGPAGARVCGENRGSDSDGLDSRLNWCVELRAATLPSGRRLTLEICRDDTGPGRLSYQDALETDFAVLDDSGREVWRWSPDHPSEGPEHTLEVAAGDCVTWTVDWTLVNAEGQPLRPGSYDLVSTTFAAELQSLPNDRLQFTVE